MAAANQSPSPPWPQPLACLLFLYRIVLHASSLSPGSSPASLSGPAAFHGRRSSSALPPGPRPTGGETHWRSEHSALPSLQPPASRTCILALYPVACSCPRPTQFVPRLTDLGVAGACRITPKHPYLGLIHPALANSPLPRFRRAENRGRRCPSGDSHSLSLSLPVVFGSKINTPTPEKYRMPHPTSPSPRIRLFPIQLTPPPT